MQIVYIGGFPAPYGGVTIKNQNLYAALSQTAAMERVDLNRVKRKDVREGWRMLRALFGRNRQLIIGVAGVTTRKLFTGLLYFCNRRAMERSIIMMMGGTFGSYIADDPRYLHWVSHYGTIYVETEGMVRQLEQAGLQNAKVYPNGRFRPEKELPIHPNDDGPLRCVAFSQVSREKGADLVLEAAKALPKVNFTIYGTVVPDYAEEFEREAANCPNVRFGGTFKGTPEEIYRELNGQDVMLFPSRWKHEGVPGVLVESKIAGIPAIVSKIAYNAELVRDQQEGLVLPENTAEALIQAIQSLDKDRSGLTAMKRQSQASAERFYIENYVEILRKRLEELRS